MLLQRVLAGDFPIRRPGVDPHSAWLRPGRCAKHACDGNGLCWSSADLFDPAIRELAMLQRYQRLVEGKAGEQRGGRPQF